MLENVILHPHVRWVACDDVTISRALLCSQHIVEVYESFERNVHLFNKIFIGEDTSYYWYERTDVVELKTASAVLRPLLPAPQAARPDLLLHRHDWRDVTVYRGIQWLMWSHMIQRNTMADVTSQGTKGYNDWRDVTRRAGIQWLRWRHKARKASVRRLDMPCTEQFCKWKFNTLVLKIKGEGFMNIICFKYVFINFQNKFAHQNWQRHAWCYERLGLFRPTIPCKRIQVSDN